MPTLIVYCACPDAVTADRLARAVVEARLAACVNVLPGIRSTYRWHERVEQADEGQNDMFPGAKPINIVVPFAAGGPTDRVARDLAEAMRKYVPGSNFVVENAAGAGGTIGASKVAKAAPDGHTLLLFHIGMAATPALYRKISYKPLEDYEFLGMVNDVPMTLIGKPQLPANTYRDFEN